MAVVKKVPVEDLELDLSNYRTTKQTSEIDSIKAMIAISPGRFFGVFESIIDEGFLLNENIVVQKEGERLIVKEGNRRIASLKIVLGFLKVSDFNFSQALIAKVGGISKKWKTNNSKISCCIYSEKEKEQVNKIVSLTHGKGQKAGRDPWEAVAKARYNRDENGKKESALDVLEIFLDNNSELTTEQIYRWSGTYPITVLDEALKKVAPSLGYKNAPELATKYPKIKKVANLNRLINDIGNNACKFKTLRATNPNFLDIYDLHVVKEANPQSQRGTTTTTGGNSVNPNPHISGGGTNGNPTQTSPSTGNSTSSNSPTSTPITPTNTATQNPNSNSIPAAVSNKDLRNIRNLLSTFVPRGQNRQKVVAIRDEMKRLNVKATPIAFCFLLRSIFEISVKAYCKDYSIRTTKNNGQDRNLVDLLRLATNHITGNKSDKKLVKEIHGAMTEIAKPDGVLSVTSLNHLVHNPNFSIIASDIATLFGNIFPLLEKLN